MRTYRITRADLNDQHYYTGSVDLARVGYKVEIDPSLNVIHFAKHVQTRAIFDFSGVTLHAHKGFSADCVIGGSDLHVHEGDLQAEKLTMDGYARVYQGSLETKEGACVHGGIRVDEGRILSRVQSGYGGIFAKQMIETYRGGIETIGDIKAGGLDIEGSVSGRCVYGEIGIKVGSNLYAEAEIESGRGVCVGHNIVCQGISAKTTISAGANPFLMPEWRHQEHEDFGPVGYVYCTDISGEITNGTLMLHSNRSPDISNPARVHLHAVEHLRKVFGALSGRKQDKIRQMVSEGILPNVKKGVAGQFQAAGEISFTSLKRTIAALPVKDQQKIMLTKRGMSS